MANKKTSKKKAEAKVKTAKAEVKNITKNSKKVGENFLNEITKPKFLACIIAELVGTFLLASAVIITQGQPLGVFFALMAIVFVLGAVSGAHVNPLITVGAWATRRISTIKAGAYIIAQVLGAMLAFVVLNYFVTAQASEQSNELQMLQQQGSKLFTANIIPEGKQFIVMVTEFLGALIFSFGVATVTSNKKQSETSVALGVAGSLYLAVIIAGSCATAIGASAILNPAVALTLQAYTLEKQDRAWAIAIYVGTALIGGILGFVLSSLVRKNSEK